MRSNKRARTGDSAGGHLSAALTFLWRRAILKRGVELLPPIRLQMLFYPVLQGVNFSTTSYLINRYIDEIVIELLNNYS